MQNTLAARPGHSASGDVSACAKCRLCCHELPKPATGKPGVGHENRQKPLEIVDFVLQMPARVHARTHCHDAWPGVDSGGFSVGSGPEMRKRRNEPCHFLPKPATQAVPAGL